jgi:peptidoglycan/LPS O-acetylase OafA/YrhL
MKLQHLDYLDGWRGLAIVFLLIGHFFPVRGINFGAVGVNLFFVLSGLLMTQLLFVAEVPLPTFYQRRVARILPAFFLMLVVVTVWWAAGGRRVEWPQVLAAAFFVNNYTVHTPADMPFGHIWSLSVEEHAYIVLSLLALLVRRTRLAPATAIGACALAFAGFGIWYWSHYSGPALNFGLLLHTEVAAYGIFVSGVLLLLLRRRQLPVLPWPLFPALVAAGMALHWWSVAAPVRTILGVALFALAVNLLRAAPPVVKSVLSWRILRQLGIWSFSIYLWQQPFYLAAHHGELAPALALVLAFAAGILSYYFIEQPARAYLNTLRVQRTSPVLPEKAL